MFDKNTRFMNYKDPKTGKTSIISYNEGLKLNIDSAKLDRAMGKMQEIVATRPRQEQLSAEPQTYENPSQQTMQPQNPMAQQALNYPPSKYDSRAAVEPYDIMDPAGQQARQGLGMLRENYHPQAGQGQASIPEWATPLIGAGHSFASLLEGIKQPFLPRGSEEQLNQEAMMNALNSLHGRAFRQSPLKTLAGSIGGGLAIPGGVMGMFGKGIMGAARGGAALSAANYGSIPERLISGATGGVLGGALQGAGQLAGAIGRRAAAPFVENNPGITNKMRSIVEKGHHEVGEDLSRASQETGVPLTADERYNSAMLGGLLGTKRGDAANKAFGEFKEAQAGAYQNSLDNFLDKFPSEVPLTQVQNAFKGVNKKSATIRKEATEPLYTDALINVPATEKNNLAKQIVKDRNLKEFIDGQYGLLMKSPVIKKQYGNLSPYDPQILHLIKYMKVRPKGEATSAQGLKHESGLYTKEYNNLQNMLENVSPAYKEATKQYASYSKIFDELKRLGVTKAGKHEIQNLHQIPDFLFSSKAITNKDFIKIRNLVEETDPKAWGGMVRNYIEQRLDKVVRHAGGLKNADYAPDVTNALFKNNTVGERLRLSMPSNLKKDFENLSKVGRVISRAPKAKGELAKSGHGLQMMRATSEAIAKRLRPYSDEDLVKAFIDQQLRLKPPKENNYPIASVLGGMQYHPHNKEKR